MMQKSHFNLMVVVYKKIERESLYGTDHKSNILLGMLWIFEILAVYYSLKMLTLYVAVTVWHVSIIHANCSD